MKGLQEVLPQRNQYRILVFLLVLLVLGHLFYVYPALKHSNRSASIQSYTRRAQLLDQCKQLRTPAGPPPSFEPSSRISTGSDRYVPGTPPTLLRNAKIWTGARNGTETIFGDILLEKGLITAIGHVTSTRIAESNSTGDLRIVDVSGSWITPGLVDLHSHLGVESAPSLSGASDGNSRKAPILPWLRSIDGLNTHDDAYELSIAGGVTTAQVLPGSANNIGGQSFVIKLRSTAERSAISKVVEPPATLFSAYNGTDYVNWRHMKHACGENPRRVYGETRMDGIWNFRNAYNEARKIKDAQDAYCDQLESSNWQNVVSTEFPENLQWESLIDVLRGKVKLSVHCYEAVDLDGIVRLSNEFSFPVASFHHAGETYLVPDLLKKTWGGVPSIALFANNFRRKREAYRSSKFAPKVLAENSIPVVMKSDHPVLNSRYLLFEAQQAHYYGLDAALALASVTSTPAKAAGLSHRVGTLAKGYDADVVIWDSHPLSLGATPAQVYIDGIAQLNEAHVSSKPEKLQQAPKTPNWDEEAKETVRWNGLPPLTAGRRMSSSDAIIKFIHVKSVSTRSETGGVKILFESAESQNGNDVIVKDGKIECITNTLGSCDHLLIQPSVVEIDLHGGSLAPGLKSFGWPLGLIEIKQESSTNDGDVFDSLTGGSELPSILSNTTIRAIDGLQFETRNALVAYHAGVTQAITAPVGSGFMLGLSCAFSVGAKNILSPGAVAQEEVALHITIGHNVDASISTQIAAIRNQLFESSLNVWQRVRQGETTLVVNVQSADIMSSLLLLKADYEKSSGRKLKLTFSDATEAHVLAAELGEAGVNVILTAPRPFPSTWEQKRIIPGPPLTHDSAITILLKNNVNVAIGSDPTSSSQAQNLRFDIAWAALESNGTISKEQAIAFATSNLDQALGIKNDEDSPPDIVVYEGGDILDLESKVVGVISAQRNLIEFF